MGNWAQLYADLTAQLQAGQALGLWATASVGLSRALWPPDAGACI